MTLIEAKTYVCCVLDVSFMRACVWIMLILRETHGLGLVAMVLKHRTIDPPIVGQNTEVERYAASEEEEFVLSLLPCIFVSPEDKG